MEIHAPEGPIHSLKQFALHLLTITLGILIALGAEGIREHYHHVHLAEQARANLRSEIAENRAKLTRNIQSLSQTQQHLVQVAVLRKRGEFSKAEQVGLDADFTNLSSSSWETAVATQAVNYMDYSDVEQYANIYNIQRRLDDVQKEAIRFWIEGAPVVTRPVHDDLVVHFSRTDSVAATSQELPQPELLRGTDSERYLETARIYLRSIAVIESKLLDAYDKAAKTGE